MTSERPLLVSDVLAVASAPGAEDAAREDETAGLSHDALIERFYETEGDPVIGRELSIRLFKHGGFADDPRTTPLIGRNGIPIKDGGKTLMQADYVNYAAKHHFEAVEAILSFLRMKPGDEDYESTHASILGRMGAGGA